MDNTEERWGKENRRRNSNTKTTQKPWPFAILREFISQITNTKKKIFFKIAKFFKIRSIIFIFFFLLTASFLKMDNEQENFNNIVQMQTERNVSHFAASRCNTNSDANLAFDNFGLPSSIQSDTITVSIDNNGSQGFSLRGNATELSGTDCQTCNTNSDANLAYDNFGLLSSSANSSKCNTKADHIDYIGLQGYNDSRGSEQLLSSCGNFSIIQLILPTPVLLRITLQRVGKISIELHKN